MTFEKILMGMSVIFALLTSWQCIVANQKLRQADMILMGAKLQLQVAHKQYNKSQQQLNAETDTIHHEEYGDYPAVVPFHQGMDLMPGQSATFNVEIPTD